MARISLPAPAEIRVVPEYDRTLELVLVSVPMWEGEATEGSPPVVPFDFLYWIYAELVEAMPEYSEILATVSPTDGPRVQALLEKAKLDRRINLHVVSGDPSELVLDPWAQDLGEIILDGDEAKFLVSLPVRGSHEQNRLVSQYRHEQVLQLFGSIVKQAAFVFEGGNLAFDAVDGAQRILVGYDDVQLTLEHYQATGQLVTRSTILDMISDEFGGAEVVEMGDELQSPFIRHLDQAFILLAGGIAIVNVTVGDDVAREQRQLARYKIQLEELGYRVSTLDNSSEEIRGYRNSLNAVPFLDKETKTRKVIFPVFPGEVVPDYDGRLERTRLRGKAARAYDLFFGAGYEPIPVRDFAFVAGGNTHCIANVLR